MAKSLARMLTPKTVAVIGGGAWCRAVVDQLLNMGFSGPIWLVHPAAEAGKGYTVFRQIEDLPAGPDAAFIGINRNATIASVSALAKMNAGGAVCFASGFAEVSDGEELNADLIEAAGEMPILGPNCYGLINALDGVLLWPDQHGCAPVAKGVAILSQSSNIAINLSMQMRGLPIAYIITCGNQAQTSQADVATALLGDERVTAIGLHIEGMGDLTQWQRFARKARERGVDIVVLKAGASKAAQTAAISHSASIAGSSAGSTALFKRLGFAQVHDLPAMVEVLKILHTGGRLPSKHIASLSCSGGEAALAADLADVHGLIFPALSEGQVDRLGQILGPKVALSNPLDYHTYIWRDTNAMAKVFAAMSMPEISLTMIIADFPRSDRCDPSDWDCVVDAVIAANDTTGGRFAVCATLPELMPESVAIRLLNAGIAALSGLTDAFAAISAVGSPAPETFEDIVTAEPVLDAVVLSEIDAKQVLSEHGVNVPRGAVFAFDQVQTALQDLSAPLAAKGIGLAHKSDAGAVILDIETAKALTQAASDIGGDALYIEEMVKSGVAELLIGVVHDPAHGFVLTLATGGVMTELLHDRAHLLLPASKMSIRAALDSLKTAPILTGFRGRKTANMEAIITAIVAIQSYVLAHKDKVVEVEVNPLICTPTTAIAADALIRKAP